MFGIIAMVVAAAAYSGIIWLCNGRKFLYGDWFEILVIACFVGMIAFGAPG